MSTPPSAPEELAEAQDDAPPGARGPLRPAAGHVRLDARLDRRLDVAARDHPRPRRQPDRLHLGRHRDAADHGDLHPDLGQARRPVQPQAAVPARDRRSSCSPPPPPASRRTPTTLIAFRAVQGIGAGGLAALSQVLMADIISPRERGRYMGLFGAVMAVATVGGPLLGGVITDTLGLALELLRRAPLRDRRAHHPAAHAAHPARAQAQGHDRLPRHRAALGRRLAAAHLGHARRRQLRVVEPRDRSSWSAARSLAAVAVHHRRAARRTSRSSRCRCSATAPSPSRSSPRSPPASRCSAPRSSSASTCSWPAARRRPRPAS